MSWRSGTGPILAPRTTGGRTGGDGTGRAKAISLNTSELGPNKKPLFFGAVQIKKSYVRYHLFPLYASTPILIPSWP